MLWPENRIGPMKTQNTSNQRKPNRTKNAGYRALNLKILTSEQHTQIATMLLNSQCLE